MFHSSLEVGVHRGVCVYILNKLIGSIVMCVVKHDDPKLSYGGRGFTFCMELVRMITDDATTITNLVICTERL